MIIRQAQLLGMAPRLVILGLSFFFWLHPLSLFDLNHSSTFQMYYTCSSQNNLNSFHISMHSKLRPLLYRMHFWICPWTFHTSIVNTVWGRFFLSCEIIRLSLFCLHMIELRSPSSAKTFYVILHKCTSVTLNWIVSLPLCLYSTEDSLKEEIYFVTLLFRTWYITGT